MTESTFSILLSIEGNAGKIHGHNGFTRRRANDSAHQLSDYKFGASIFHDSATVHFGNCANILSAPAERQHGARFPAVNPLSVELGA
jgi:hypothetical protein